MQEQQTKLFSAVRRVLIAIAVGSVAVLAVACGQPASHPRQQVKPTVGKVNQALPAVVNGVPLLDLAKHALGAAEAYSVSKPVAVRAVISTQAALYAQMSSRRRCNRTGVCHRAPRALLLWGVWRRHCDNSTYFNHDDRSFVRPCLHNGAAATAPLAIGTTTGIAVGVAVGVHTPNMAKLGRVYALAHTSSLWPGSRFRLARSPVR